MRITLALVGNALVVAMLLQPLTLAAQTIFAYAGTGEPGYNGDDPDQTALTAQLNVASSIATDASGNLYITETASHRLRKVTPAGVITTLLGTGVSGTGLDQLTQPVGVAVHAASGDVYVADTSRHRILRLPGGAQLPGGGAELFAGTGTIGTGASGIAATSSALAFPRA